MLSWNGMKLVYDAARLAEFKKIIWQFYAQEGRIFNWRNVDDPYKVFISEVMLQQTQTYRVAPKYTQFIAQFSTWNELASASLRSVLLAWQGLGYNRRGKFLHESAKIVVNQYNGILPDDPLILETFPGIGKATASSICAFAFNKPTTFIETNIRSVFIYFFFAGKNEVHDKDILPLVQATVDNENPRDWYYALMDYGVMLKKQLKNPSRKSAHHTIQSKFEGSDRQIRGMIIRILSASTKPVLSASLFQLIKKDHERVEKIIDELLDEQMISKADDNAGFQIK